MAWTVRRGWWVLRRVDPRTVDAALAVALAAALVAGLWPGPPEALVAGLWPASSAAGAVPALAGSLLLAGPLAVRRRWPLWCFTAQLAGVLLAHAALTGPAGLAALTAGGYSVAAAPGRRARAVAVLGAAGAVLAIRYTAAGGVLILVAAWLAAGWVRSLRSRAELSERYARSVLRERDAARRLAVQGERTRIARELHDVLGHHVSVMTIQAGAARQVLGTSPAEAAGALRAAEEAGRQAMAELRHLLHLLAPADGTDELVPRPGLDGLEALLAGATGAGQPVTLTVDGPPRPVPEGLQLTAYRVVQEGLTNALRHAAGAVTEVRVGYRPAELRVEVRDAGGRARAGTTAGRGLSGLRERVACCGGSFTAGPTAAGGYRIRARFPLGPA